ncbi:MAG: universal stress protein [Planctomycetota bacterium]|jgi:nucleotide-binding universal stress UspA family protein
MYKTILVPIDMSHSERGKSMIEIARMQGDEEAQIILLHVIEDIPNWVAAEMPAGILEQSRQTIQEELQAIANAASIKADVVIRSGHPYRTILDKAEEENVDLIVIASHRPGLQDYFLGSTAAKVVRHAKCSVLVVR